jgi:hypothetical protein
MNDEFTRVLSNWIKEATSPGELPKGKSVEEWIAERVVDWWREKIIDDIESLETTAYALREDLENIGGLDRKESGDAMHELIHLDDNISDLRTSLGLQDQNHDAKDDR